MNREEYKKGYYFELKGKFIRKSSFLFIKMSDNHIIHDGIILKEEDYRAQPKKIHTVESSEDINVNRDHMDADEEGNTTAHETAADETVADETAADETAADETVADETAEGETAEGETAEAEPAADETDADKEAEENFKMFLQALMMKKMLEKKKIHIVEEEEGEEGVDGDQKNDKKVFIDMDYLFLLFAGVSLFNIFIFFYNMNCIEYYHDKIDSTAKFGFVYTIFQYIRDVYVFSLLEKISYTFILLYVLNLILGMVVDRLLPKGDKKIGGGSGGSGLGGLSHLFGEKTNTYKIEEKGKTGVSFNDVAGCHVAKGELLELIDFLQNREKYTKLGAQLPKGALLYGPSGTGKTMIAKALAHEVAYNYIYVQGSDFKKPLVGLGPQSVKELFETARKNAPCIIFIDEIDSFAKKRGSDAGGGGGSTSHSEEDAVLNTFLAELDGFKERGDIFVMGATNRLNVIDDALLRPKRFDRIIHFKLPNVDERYEIIDSYFQKMTVNETLRSEAYKRLLAKKSYGFSGAQIFNMCNEACILAGKHAENEVNESHVHDALDYIHLGKTEEHVKAHLTDDEKRRTAYHETGHAIMALISKELENPTQISIVPHNKGSLGVTLTPVNEHKYSKTRDDYVARLAMLLGGRMAEEVFIGNVSGGAKDDLNKFNELVDDYFNSGIESVYLTSESEYRNRNVKVSEKYLEELEMKKQQFIAYIFEYTRSAMITHSEKIHEIAKELMEKEDMYEEDISKYLVKK